MPNEANALSGKPGAPSQGYYQSGRAALSSAARAQPAADADVQRSRQAVTQMLLSAIERLEAEVASGSDAVGRYRSELRQLLEAIRIARPQWGVDNDLAALLRLLERRIDAMVTPKETAPPVDLAAARAPEPPEAPGSKPAASLAELALPPDPLADILALTEEERIALFT
jgi:hypothetical protein